MTPEHTLSIQQIVRRIEALKGFDVVNMTEDQVRHINSAFYTEFIVKSEGVKINLKFLNSEEINKIPMSKLYLSAWIICNILMEHKKDPFFNILEVALENPPPKQAKGEFDELLAFFGSKDIVLAFWVRLIRKNFLGFLCSFLQQMKFHLNEHIQQLLRAETRYEEPVQQSPPLLYRPQIAPNAPALN